MENYNRQNIQELAFDFTDDNGVTFVDAYFLDPDKGRSLGFIFNKQFYPRDEDYRTDGFIMESVQEHINTLN